MVQIFVCDRSSSLIFNRFQVYACKIKLRVAMSNGYDLCNLVNRHRDIHIHTRFERLILLAQLMKLPAQFTSPFSFPHFFPRLPCPTYFWGSG